MPELPEVETVRRGMERAAAGGVVCEVIVRRAALRRPLPPDLAPRLRGKRLMAVRRRGKYLLLEIGAETCIVHLGMSGAFKVSALPPADKHDHVAFLLDGARYLIYNDPRRFGLMALAQGDALSHPLLAGLGVEPLTRAFGGAALARLLANKKTPIKTALLDARLVAGIGNIYASESLFAAGVHPQRGAATLTADECGRLATAIKQTLRRAIAAGGSTLRDFTAADGKPGYFQHQWAVYDRAGQPCANGCGHAVARLRQGGRSSYFCPACQPCPEAARDV